MKLSLKTPPFHQIRKGQTLSSIARTYHLPPRVLAAVNGLTEEPQPGAVLMIPNGSSNLYTVMGGESMTLLCGSRENFERKNMTKHLYPGQIILL